MRARTRGIIRIGAAGALSAALAFGVAAQQRASAHAELKNAQGETIGNADLKETAQGVLVMLHLTNAPAGEHGFHVHQTGKCDPPTFESAGGHFNPAGAQHGFESEKGVHAGDMPNLHVPDGGKLDVEVLLPNATIEGGANALLDQDGAALMLHEKADDYRSDPAGAAGSRLACGVITKK